MKTTPASRLRRGFLFLLLILVTTFTTSCTVFKLRYNAWNRSVSRDPDGVLTHAQPFSRGEGDTALLLIHGFGDGPHVWTKLASELETRQVHVRCMRLPGWNEPMDAKRNVTAEDWKQAVTDEWQALRSSHETVVILAHSLGGCVTVAALQSDRLEPDGLILYAPLMRVSSARSPLLTTRQWYKLGSHLLPDGMIVESLFPDHAVRTTPRPRTLRDPFVSVNVFHELYSIIQLIEQQEAATPCPVRLVLPETDRVVDSETALAWFERLQAPAKELHTEENSGHVLPLELDPVVESDRILEWIQAKGITK